MPKFLPINFKKSSIKKFTFSIYILSFFILALGILIGAPRATQIIESRVYFLGNQNPEKIQPLVAQVAGAQEREETQIIDAQIPAPEHSAAAILVQDFESGRILFQKNIHTKLSPASTTKIMTALISSEHYKPADILTVTEESLVGGSTMGLNLGEKLTYRSLLYGMMLNSGNDAAFTIAANYPGGVSAFVAKMNQKALEMGLKDTHFTNPAGFDAPDHLSSATDLSQIAKAAVVSSQISKVVSTKETSVISWDKSRSHILKNLNKLLGEDGVMGIKTGFTEKSGENLIGLVERNNHKVLTVVLNSQDRFGETKALMDWVYTNFSWR